MMNSIFDCLASIDRLAFLAAYEETGTGGLTKAERAELADLRAKAKEAASVLPELAGFANYVPNQDVLAATQLVREAQKLAGNNDTCIHTTGNIALSALPVAALDDRSETRSSPTYMFGEDIYNAILRRDAHPRFA